MSVRFSPTSESYLSPAADSGCCDVCFSVDVSSLYCGGNAADAQSDVVFNSFSQSELACECSVLWGEMGGVGLPQAC